MEPLGVGQGRARQGGLSRLGRFGDGQLFASGPRALLRSRQALLTKKSGELGLRGSLANQKSLGGSKLHPGPPLEFNR